MARVKKTTDEVIDPIRPAMSAEVRENQLIALATNLAEKQLREGTASPLVISHYLKLATKKHEMEMEMLAKQKDLMQAKTENLQSTKRLEELTAEALEAMKRYSGNMNGE